MKITEFKEVLEELKTRKLPGERAYKKIYPGTRAKYDSTIAATKPRQSAVLILFCHNKDGEIYIPLIERTKDNSTHSGQISFPGGKYEDSDLTYDQTALRETWEEIGIEPSLVDVTQKLTPLYIPVSNFMVHPYIGLLETNPEFVLSTNEVEKVVRLYISELSKPKIIHKTLLLRGKGVEIPFYKFKEFEVWGATAMILSEMMALIED